VAYYGRRFSAEKHRSACKILIEPALAINPTFRSHVIEHTTNQSPQAELIATLC